MADPAPSDKRPTDINSYLEWLRKAHQVDAGSSLKTRYETIVAKLKADFSSSPFWNEVMAAIPDLDSEYRLRHHYPLFLGNDLPMLQNKSYESFLLKTFRRNVIDNENWPRAPKGDWFLPENSYSRFNDLVRTSFIVKYLDGVSFLGDRLARICENNDVDYDLTFEARMEGHYAAHLCTNHRFEIPGPKWDTETIKVTVEFQIITQLQELIRKLLHRYYEDRRVTPERDRSNWQWKYESDEFSANYLGHILHYIEGMIMEIRARQQESARTN